MRKAVMYGAGKIGRGFIGEKMHKSGYEVCFLDVEPKVVNAINQEGGYHVIYVSDGTEKQEYVNQIRACVANTEEAGDAIAECDILATAVGVRNLKDAARQIAAGLEKRAGGAPLNIILAENQMGVDELMRKYLYAQLSPETKAWAQTNLGLVAASIQRMVPQPGEAYLKNDALCVVTEPFDELPVDADAIKGSIPPLEHMLPCTPFDYQEKRKLFMHNMAHALIAYMANVRGYTFIWQALEDQEILGTARSALQSVSRALAKEFAQPLEDLYAYSEDLLVRFSNRALGDTVQRVGADPLRKLRNNDRLVGAALYVEEMGESSAPIVEGIVSAFRFDVAEDPSAQKLLDKLHKVGIQMVLEEDLGVEGTSLKDLILTKYQQMQEQDTVSDTCAP